MISIVPTPNGSAVELRTHGERASATQRNAIHMGKQTQNSVAETSVSSHCDDYTRKLIGLLEDLDHGAVDEVVRLLLDARERGSHIIFIGNGGSASTASHFAIDIGIGTKGGDNPFRAISLTDNNAILTGLANDFGYDQVFVRQLRVSMRPGDVLFAISASGNSPNLLEAVAFANSLGNHTIGLTGFDGGKLREICSTSLHVPTAKGDYGLVEDMHLVINHIMTSHLTKLISAE
jgi:D-sedoheptulose 7-phosphate isomerase